jgi:hypothetical protein
MEFFYEAVAVAALVAAGVFALYFIKHTLEAAGRRREAKRKAERLICALYAEIKARTSRSSSPIRRRWTASSRPSARAAPSVRT